MSIPVRYSVADALAEVGLLPKTVTLNDVMNVEVLVPANGIMMLRFDVPIVRDDLVKIAQAFALLDARQHGRL